MSRLVILLSILFQTIPCLADDTITISDHVVHQRIGKSVKLLEDETGLLKVEEVIHSTKFKSNNEDIPNLGTSKTYWAKFKIKNLSTNSIHFLELAYPLMDFVELYTLLPDGKTKKEQSGDAYPFVQRPYKHQHYIFKLKIPQDSTTTYFMRVRSEEPMMLPLTIKNPENLVESLLIRDLLCGIFFGLAFIMIIYNFFIYVSIRDKSYLYYVLYSTCITFTQATILGYPNRFIWTDSPWFINQSIIFFPAISGCFISLFMVSFLEKVDFEKDRKFLLTTLPLSLSFLYLIAIVLSALGWRSAAFRIIDLNALIYSTYIFYVLIVSVKKGYHPAKFLLAGWTVILSGFIIFSLRNLNLLPYNNLTNNTMPIGLAIEVTLFSFALAYRINILKKENEDKQNEIIHHLKDNERHYLATKESELIIEKLKKENLQSQFESLKNQINPHFLFNSLNVLTELITQNADKAVTFVKELSDVYRYVLENKNKEVVDLETELEFINAFSYLLKIRFSDTLKINNRIRDGLKEILIPPLTLQMLIENCIKHNIVSEEKPLIIDIFIEEGYLIVKNNIQRKKIKGIPSGLGLKNIESRFNFLTDKKISIVEDADSFTVSIPTLKYQEK